MASSIPPPPGSSASVPRGSSTPAQLVSASRTRNGQCTHLTMTRLWSSVFRCSLCLQAGSFSWVYRCTQDRELMLEDDFECGNYGELDAIGSVFTPWPSKPKKRSAAARATDKFAFLNEPNDEEWKTYSEDQVATILQQRAHLIDILELSKDDNNPSSLITLRTPAEVWSKREKPWLSSDECQFKCCHTCRMSSVERSFLSLNGVADNDIPLTAVTGFGFPTGKRPVSLVKHVVNLGLRQSPLQTQVSSKFIAPNRSWQHSFHPLPMIPSPMSTQNSEPNPFTDEPDADTTFGQPSNAYDSTAMTKRINIEGGSSFAGLGIDYDPSSAHDMVDYQPQNTLILQDGYTTAARKDIPATEEIRPADTPPNSPRRVLAEHGKHGAKSTEILQAPSNGRSDMSLRTNVTLRSRFNLDTLKLDENISLDTGISVGPSTTDNNTIKFSSAIPKEPQGPNWTLVSKTDMEEEEEAEHQFGSTPLHVQDGLALTEEGVEFHVPDVVTQY